MRQREGILFTPPLRRRSRCCAGSDGQPQSPSNLFCQKEKSTFGRSCTCSFHQHGKSQPPWKIHQKQGKELSPTQPAFCCYYFSWKTEYTTRTMHFTTGAVALWCLSLKTNAFSTNCKRFLDHVLTHPIDPVSRGSKSNLRDDVFLSGCYGVF